MNNFFYFQDPKFDYFNSDYVYESNCEKQFVDYENLTFQTRKWKSKTQNSMLISNLPKKMQKLLMRIFFCFFLNVIKIGEKLTILNFCAKYFVCQANCQVGTFSKLKKMKKTYKNVPSTLHPSLGFTHRGQHGL